MYTQFTKADDITLAALRQRIEMTERDLEELRVDLLNARQTIEAQTSIIAELRTALSERDARLAQIGRTMDWYQ